MQNGMLVHENEFRDRIFTVFAHLFAKLPQPGDRQVTYSICHLLLLV